MDTDRINDLAALMAGNLSQEEQEALLQEISSDTTATDVVSMLGLPGLSVQNNAVLPFETNASFLGRWCQDYVRPISTKNLRYAKRSADLLAHLARIVGGQKAECFRKELDLDYEIPDRLGVLRVTLAVERDQFALTLAHKGPGGEDGTIEVWEQGNLIRKSTCSTVATRPIVGRASGSAISVRHSDSPVGAEILLSEIEFSRNDWKAACLSACVAGQLAEALRIFQNKSVEFSEGTHLLERIYGVVSAIQVLTRSEGFALRPALATRSLADSERRTLGAYRPVWQGILSCWPNAGHVPNPWDRGEIERDSDHIGIAGIAAEARPLVEACLAAGSGDVFPKPVTLAHAAGDPRVLNGWRALEGWTCLIHDEYEKAHKAFASVEPIEGDPFGLVPGGTLSNHLALAQDEVQSEEEIAISSDKVWGDTFSFMM